MMNFLRKYYWLILIACVGIGVGLFKFLPWWYWQPKRMVQEKLLFINCFILAFTIVLLPIVVVILNQIFADVVEIKLTIKRDAWYIFILFVAIMMFISGMSSIKGFISG